MNKLFKAVWILAFVLLFSVGIIGQSVSIDQVDHIQAADGGGNGYGGGGLQIADGGNGYGGGG